MRDPEFRRFWFGQTVSLFGSQVTLLALPLTAILVLNATPLQMGLLGAAGFIPFLLLTLFAGVWIDRHRRRPVLVVANVVRAALIGLIPLAAVFGWVSFALLLLVAFVSGICAVFFEVSFPAYLPSLVGRDQLTAANARIVGSMSAASVAGPGLAGMLISVLGAPIALLADALTYLVSGAAFASIRRPERSPGERARRGLQTEIAEGLRVTFGSRILRTFAAEAAMFNLFASAVTAVFLLFATRELELSPAAVGVLFMIGAAGSLAGSVAAGPLAARLGLGPTIAIAMVVACVPYLGMPFVGGPTPLAFGVLAAILVAEGFGVAISVVHVITIRQSVTPDHLLARMNASYRMVVYGVIPLGSLLGGLAGELLGLRAALLIGAIGVAAAPMWVLLSPIPRIRGLDELVREADHRPRVAPGAVAETA